MSFHTFGLSAELLRAVTEQGYREPTPIQTRAIPPILEGRDVLAAAQTGTGKTAGFTLPLLQRLATSSPRAGRGAVRTLILTPTRELAAQVEESVRTYGKHLPLRSAVIFGGVGIHPQVEKLRRGVDILVATPGRLLDHVSQRTVDLSHVEILVLDEADRMLDMGFIRDIRRIISLLPRHRQTLLFSATFTDEIRELANNFLTSPIRIEAVGGAAPPELVSQVVHPVDRERKSALLSFLIGTGNWKQVLVFTRTKRGADRLTRQLERDGIRAAAIHSDKSQKERTRTLLSFKRGTVRVLVATDLASRGLDIDQLPHVVNFELPLVPQDYVHRIGRTGRAGTEGDAVSLVCLEEREQLNGIERLLRCDIEKVVIAGYEPQSTRRRDSISSRRPLFGLSNGRGDQKRTQGRPGRSRGRSKRKTARNPMMEPSLSY